MHDSEINKTKQRRLPYFRKKSVCYTINDSVEDVFRIQAWGRCGPNCDGQKLETESESNRARKVYLFVSDNAPYFNT